MSGTAARQALEVVRHARAGTPSSAPVQHCTPSGRRNAMLSDFAQPITSSAEQELFCELTCRVNTSGRLQFWTGRDYDWAAMANAWNTEAFARAQTQPAADAAQQIHVTNAGFLKAHWRSVSQALAAQETDVSMAQVQQTAGTAEGMHAHPLSARAAPDMYAGASTSAAAAWAPAGWAAPRFADGAAQLAAGPLDHERRVLTATVARDMNKQRLRAKRQKLSHSGIAPHAGLVASSTPYLPYGGAPTMGVPPSMGNTPNTSYPVASTTFGGFGFGDGVISGGTSAGQVAPALPRTAHRGAAKNKRCGAGTGKRCSKCHHPVKGAAAHQHAAGSEPCMGSCAVCLRPMLEHEGKWCARAGHNALMTGTWG